MTRCRSYFYGRGVIHYRFGKRCEFDMGHSGQHLAAGSFIDPHQHHRWGRVIAEPPVPYYAADAVRMGWPR